MPWRRECPPTQVFWPVESQGHRSLAAYRPWGHKESDMPDRLTLLLRRQYMERKQFWWINHLLAQILKHKFGSSGNYCLVSQILSAHINNWKCPQHKEFLLSSSRISPSSDENRYLRGKKKKKTTPISLSQTLANSSVSNCTHQQAFCWMQDVLVLIHLQG